MEQTEEVVEIECPKCKEVGRYSKSTMDAAIDRIHNEEGEIVIRCICACGYAQELFYKQNI